jgi:cytochrome c1
VPHDCRDRRQGTARARSHPCRKPLVARAGTLENTAAARAHWIADPQAYKPGVDMPPLAVAPADLVAISAYLGSLQ